MKFSPLRPDPRELAEDWLAIVIEEYEQVESVREWHDEDHYQPIAHHFADDPYRKDDEILNRLLSFSSPEMSWLDIGAGGGRYALPLALGSKHVTAVEPSGGMRQVMKDGVTQYTVGNLDIMPYRWPEGSDEIRADISLAAHVGYDIRDINGFVDGMERATSELCIMLLMDRAPSGGFTRLWEEVHGFPRQQLPAFREFLHLLLARGATPEVELYPRSGRKLEGDDLRIEARRRLWLVEGSEKDQKLQEVLTEEFAQGVNDYQRAMTVAMIRWRP